MLSVWCSIAAVLSAVRLFEEVGRRKKKEKRKSRKGEKEQLRGRDLKVKKKGGRKKKKKKRKKEKKKTSHTKFSVDLDQYAFLKLC